MLRPLRIFAVDRPHSSVARLREVRRVWASSEEIRTVPQPRDQVVLCDKSQSNGVDRVRVK